MSRVHDGRARPDDLHVSRRVDAIKPDQPEAFLRQGERGGIRGEARGIDRIECLGSFEAVKANGVVVAI